MRKYYVINRTYNTVCCHGKCFWTYKAAVKKAIEFSDHPISQLLDMKFDVRSCDTHNP